MNNPNKPNYIFDDCEECGKKLNEMEKDYCKKMTDQTNYYCSICSACLDKEYEGKWPIIT